MHVVVLRMMMLAAMWARALALCRTYMHATCAYIACYACDRPYCVRTPEPRQAEGERAERQGGALQTATIHLVLPY
eukprot:6178925-Pleurochrysis_carterae.AAC.2